MISQKETGGPAFPETRWDDKTRRDIQWSGMTLRDWFAGQALGGLTVGWNDMPGSYAECTGGVASAAYGIADAMLAERSKP